MKFLVFLAILLLAPLGHTAAAQATASAKPQPKPASAHAAPSPGSPAASAKKPAATDSQIEQVFKAKLAKSKVGANDIQIRVNHGVATLEGRVNVVQHKGAATRMAKSSGAVNVINNIKISDAARQKAGQQMSRARKAQVRSE